MSTSKDAFAEIVRLGQTAAVRDMVTAHTAAAQARYARIQADRQHTPAYIAGALATALTDEDRRLADKLNSHASDTVRQDRVDFSAAFGATGSASERRAAIDRAATYEQRFLGQELAAATRASDETLARAIAERATAEGQVDVVNQFIADRPHHESAVQNLWTAATRPPDKMAGLEAAGHLAELRPAELARTDDWKVQELAEGHVEQRRQAAAAEPTGPSIGELISKGI